MPVSRSNGTATTPGGGAAAPTSAPKRRKLRFRGDLVLAILVLIFLRSGLGAGTLVQIGFMVMALIGLILLAYVLGRYLLMPLIARFDRIREYIFLMAIGWCLGLAQISGWLGLSGETGAFIAGVILATHPVALFIAESLKPLRDFFLVLFFFSMGAALDLRVAAQILPAALLLAEQKLDRRKEQIKRKISEFAAKPARQQTEQDGALEGDVPDSVHVVFP